MTVRSIIKTPASRAKPFCSPDISVFVAAVQIADCNVNALAVVDDGKLAGIITDHDIIRALADTGTELDSVNIREWMSANVVTCTAEDRLADALNLIGRYGIRHLVVTEGDTPIAVVGARDVLTRIHEHDELELRVLQDLARVTHATQTA